MKKSADGKKADEAKSAGKAPGRRGHAPTARLTTDRATIYTGWWSVPDHLSPSQPYRLVGGALTWGAVAGLATAGALFAAWHLIPGIGIGAYDDAYGAGAWLVHLLTAGQVCSEAATDWWGQLQDTGHPAAAVVLSAVSIAAGLWVAGETVRISLRPKVALKVLEGHRLVRGEDAWEAMSAFSDSITDEERKHPDHRHALPLSAKRGVWWSKTRWSRGVIVSGSVGSGKSQIILPVVAAMSRSRTAKAMIYDAKGEYLAATGNCRGGAILAPHDSRSAVWDIAQDVVELDDARVFAERVTMAVGSGGSSGEFFKKAAEILLRGVLCGLIIENCKAWGWDTFYKAAAGTRTELHKKLVAWKQDEAAALIAEPSPTTDSVLSTVRTCLTTVHVLAQAWPFNPHRSPRDRFSVREWVRDDYPTDGSRPRILYLKADGHPAIAGVWIGWLVNLAESQINRPSLRDDMTSRCLGFVFDELTSISKLDVAGLFERGRSKGVVMIIGVQDIAQVREVYGQNTATAMSGMVGTHIITQTQMSETRDTIAKRLGQQRVSWTSRSDGKITAHEEMRPVVAADFLTSGLGVADDGPDDFFCRAIVYTGKDDDIHCLDFPGTKWKQVRTPYRAAAWMQDATAAAQAAFHAALVGEPTPASAPSTTPLLTPTAAKKWAIKEDEPKSAGTEQHPQERADAAAQNPSHALEDIA